MEISILGISGSPIKGGNTETFLRETLKAAEKIDGVSTDLISVAGKKIGGCRQCGWCARKQEEGKFCRIQDDMGEIYPRLLEADVLLLATPVYFFRLSGYMAVFIDRLRCLIIGKHYGLALQNKVGGALAVSRYRNAGLEMALQTIHVGLICLQMIPASYSGFGAGAVSTYEGIGKDDPDDRLAVLKDKQGLAGARRLVRSAVQLSKILKTGQEALKTELSDVLPRPSYG